MLGKEPTTSADVARSFFASSDLQLTFQLSQRAEAWPASPLKQI